VRYALVLYLGHLDEHVSEGVEWLLEDAASFCSIAGGRGPFYQGHFCIKPPWTATSQMAQGSYCSTAPLVFCCFLTFSTQTPGVNL